MLPAIPRRPDRRPAPAWAETAAIVAAAVEARAAEIISLAVVAVIVGRVEVRFARDCALRAKHRTRVVRRLMIAGQEAIAMPMRDMPLWSGGA